MNRPFVAADDGQFDPSPRRRSAARLVLLDTANRVLLLRHDPPLHELHWAGPGGGIEPGEDAERALRREINEELLLPCRLTLTRIGDWRHVFSYRGSNVVQHESLFAARLPAGTDPASVRLGPHAAADGIGAARWCDPIVVDRLPDVWPTDLSAWLRLSERPAEAADCPEERRDDSLPTQGSGPRRTAGAR